MTLLRQWARFWSHGIMKSTMKTKFTLPKPALILMRLLEDKGFEAYVIGGFVRDKLIHRPSTDIDMATNASTQVMIELFSAYPLSLIGEKLGTVGVKVQGHWIEITTYRSESTSSNYRHPDEVRFIGSLKDDVLRRDFTINVLALNIYGDLIDYNEGLLDLQRKQIKAIGHPEDRFEEDALRILRALRFSAQLGFKIEPQTAQAMITHQGLIKTLPIERIASELDKLIMAFDAASVMRDYGTLIKPWFDFDETSLDKLTQFSDRALRYLCLMDHLDDDSIKTQLSTLKLSKVFIKKVLDLKLLSLVITQNRKTIKTLMGHYTTDLIDLAIMYQRHLNKPGIDIQCYNQLKDENPAVTLKDLKINGNDLIALGYSGKKISIILQALLEGVMNDQIPNEKAALTLATKDLP